MCSLLAMCIERYLGVYYPIFHKTYRCFTKHITRRRLLTLLAIFIILPTTITIICANDLVISGAVVCSFNSLIFFWKNKVLRDEGIKIIKKIKDRVLGS